MHKSGTDTLDASKPAVDRGPDDVINNPPKVCAMASTRAQSVETLHRLLYEVISPSIRTKLFEIYVCCIK